MGGKKRVRRAKTVEGCSFFITGGTGTFGQAMVRRALQAGAERITVYSRDECKQSQMRLCLEKEGYEAQRVEFFLGCVRDRARLEQALSPGDIVLHTAALKQVPAAEQHPIEFIKTNIEGSANLLEAATRQGAAQLLVLSTDKAVQPINLYGATKLCAEKLTLEADVRKARHGVRCSVVRYGNVMGSRGSVLPIWLEFLTKGANHFPVTSLEMTRFWITLEEAVSFVLLCLKEQQGGEIFVPRIPSTSMDQLAKAFTFVSKTTTSDQPTIAPKIVGIRPGEKLHETLLTQEEAARSFVMEDRYVILPPLQGSSTLESSYQFWQSKAKQIEGKLDAFTSDCAQEMTMEVMIDQIKQLQRSLQAQNIRGQ